MDEHELRCFAQSFAYVSGEYDDPAAFQKLSQRLEELDRQHNLEGNRLFYLATPPAVYPMAIEQIEKAGLAQQANGKSWVRIIIEKPFGRDLASARELNQTVLKVFDESQVYRIDHYLGKDTVQNLLVLRFGNGIFEPLWNRNYVDHVQITAAESLGVEQRAAFYETTGALRDMIQSHVLQLTSLVAMEAPASFRRHSRAQRKDQGAAVHPPVYGGNVARDVVRGQYGPGAMENNEDVAGYLQEPGVKPRLGDGNVCGRAAADRQLALGRRAVLHPHRKALAAARDRNRHPIPPRAASGISRAGYRYQFAGAQYSARGRHLHLLPRQAAGPGNAPEHGDHGLQLSGSLWRRRAQRLCDAAERLHARRRHAV